MTVLPFFQVDAFTLPGQVMSGNPAAVMPLDEWLDDATLQAIAAENNLSETAFTVRDATGEADYHLRWFTPTVEINLCGHATLATAHVIKPTGQDIRFRTRSGRLTVTGDGDALTLDFPAAAVAAEPMPHLVAALGLTGDIATFGGRGGNDAAIALLPDEAAVRAVRPDFAALRQIERLVIVTAPGERSDMVSRVFAPCHGIDEDPVTGSAHCALVPFWAERLGRQRLTALQASVRGGWLDCEQRGDRVRMTGGAETRIEGRFYL